MKLFSFDGRISRKEWWVLTIIIFLASVGVTAISIGGSIVTGFAFTHGASIVSGVGYIVYLISAYIGIATNVKRFHDRGKSGWWVLIALIPLIGLIWILVELGCLPGVSGDNEYGLDPLGGQVTAAVTQ